MCISDGMVSQVLLNRFGPPALAPADISAKASASVAAANDAAAIALSLKRDRTD